MCIGICIRGACCCCEACCNDSCRLLKHKFNISIRQQVRLAYIATSFVAIMFTIFVMYVAPASLGFWATFIHCPTASGGDLVCLGVSAVYRMSATLVTLYLIILLACLMRDDCARFINENFWCMKLFYVVSVFFGFMFVQNKYFEIYAQASQYISSIFLLFQIVMMIDIFYIVGEKMKAIYDRGYNAMGYLLIILALVLYTLTIYFNYKNFEWFPCDSLINWLNVALVVIITILIFTGIFKNGSLVTSGFMSLYLTFQIWSGLNNTTDSKCNAFNQEDIAMKVEIGFGVVFILCALLYISLCKYEDGGKISERTRLLDSSNQNSSSNNNRNYNTGFQAQKNNNLKDSDNEEDDRDFIEGFDSSDEDQENQNQNQQQSQQNMIKTQYKQKVKENRRIRRLKDYQTNSYIAFHVLMILSSFYIAMMLTNWRSPVIGNKDDSTSEMFKPSGPSRTINIACSYISWIVYIWTLIAPKVFVNRDFPGSN